MVSQCDISSVVTEFLTCYSSFKCIGKVRDGGGGKKGGREERREEERERGEERERARAH